MKDFFVSIVENAIEHREKNKVDRKDLMQYLIQLRSVKELNKLDDFRVKNGENCVKNI
jgi:hypothetical protein